MPTPEKQDSGSSLDLVEVKEIRDNTIIMKDGSMRQVVMVGGVNFSLKSESEQELLIQGYQTFLNSVEFPMQILIHSRKVNIDKYIQTLLVRKEAEPSTILQNQIDEYVEFVRGFVEKNAIMEKAFFVVVPFYPNVASSTVQSATGLLGGLFGAKKKAATPAGAAEEENKKEDEATFKENLEQLGQRVTQVIDGLMGAGLEATQLENAQLVELLYNFYNPQTIERHELPVARK